MGIAYFNGPSTPLAARAMLILIFSLGGCATSIAGSSPMNTRAEVPIPQLPASGYAAVEDLPPKRPMMTVDEQSKIKQELISARDHQVAPVKAPAKSIGAKRTHKAVQPTKQSVRR